MKFDWKYIANKIDSRPERERGLLFAVVLAIVVLLGMNFVVSPLLRQQKDLNAKIQQHLTMTQSMTEQLNALQIAQNVDVDANLKQKIQEYRTLLETKDQTLSQFQKSLVPSAKIDYLLESILKRNKNLRLISLRTLSVVDLMNDTALVMPMTVASNASASLDEDVKKAALEQRGLFKHEVEIVVEGGYLDMLAYMQSLESMPERVYWSRSDLSVLEYPKSRLSLRVFTLSLERKWLQL
ncbi:hypothetical protein H8K35_12045 [Undibacterium sp. LX40W]|uniref:MSHA biogenesis protein MshJ n=1 Tax=Undibacterium nitidum TaxID=2762298 RepID=A0A923HXP0_9BURK|nr:MULTISPECIES: hypothetical protein [Undibacterium]MBC3882116.1 hypothetical protein [Undibacterium nitidum]MBC3892397.1 hypothetical protein [Undibacterium sp. LX40W]